jgi:PAS domain S-box-containing protein
MTDTTAATTIEAQLRDLLHRSPLALAILDLDSMTIVDANEPTRALLGEKGEIRFPVSLRDVLLPEDRGPAERALQLVADGTISSYDARRNVLRSDGAMVRGHIWVRALSSPSKDAALVVFLPEGAGGYGDDLDDAATRPAMRLPLNEAVVVGSFDAGTRLTQISADVKKLLGRAPEELLGTALVDLVDPDDVGTLLAALGRAVTSDAGVGVRLHLRRSPDDSDGTTIPARLVVTPAQHRTGTRFGFLLTRDASTPNDTEHEASRDRDRVAELEQHLWRIASEVQAAGVVDGLHQMPDQREMPGLSELSTRQWQVLSALMRGERVPDIARSMHVSQSTVRNHLAKIFRTLGVHSQSELLALLRESNPRNV